MQATHDARGPVQQELAAFEGLFHARDVLGLGVVPHLGSWRRKGRAEFTRGPINPLRPLPAQLRSSAMPCVRVTGYYSNIEELFAGDVQTEC